MITLWMITLWRLLMAAGWICGLLGCAQPQFVTPVPNDPPRLALSGTPTDERRLREALSPTLGDADLVRCAEERWGALEQRSATVNDLQQAAWCAYRYFAEVRRRPSGETQRIQDIYNQIADILFVQWQNPSANNALIINWSSTQPVPEGAERWLRSSTYRIENINHYWPASGWGAGIFSFQDNDWSVSGRNYFPPEGITHPFTVTFQTERRNGDIELMLTAHDALTTETVQLGAHRYPLYRDRVTPYAYLLQQTELEALGRRGLLSARTVADRLGVYLLEPYNPDKIPVVMIHGLDSNPLIWRELTAAIFSDPALQQRYQVWHVIYPTGPPPFFNAGRIRRLLAQARQDLDPELDDLATNHVVIVGHSMGGLIAKTLVTDSGMDLWNATFTVPPDKLAATDAEREQLEEIFIFSAKPYVHQVFFIDTPHRGSEVADYWFVQAASAIIELPSVFTGLFLPVVQRNPDKITAQMQPYLEGGGPDSVRVLSPRHPLIRLLAEKSISPGVEYYSVIGDDGSDGPITDGVVSYASAHLDGAREEIIVPSRHDSYGHSATVAFIRRHLLNDSDPGVAHPGKLRASPKN